MLPRVVTGEDVPMNYLDIDDLIAADGLRLVLLRGFPSPWGQAAKAMMEFKGLTFSVGPLDGGHQEGRAGEIDLVMHHKDWLGENFVESRQLLHSLAAAIHECAGFE